jgi:UV DNA damage endonuclease
VRLGYACSNLSLGRPFRTLRLATLRDRGIAYLQQLVDENMRLLLDILAWNREHEILMYRLSSDLVPLGSHEAVDLAELEFPLAAQIPALTNGVRLSMHPGQYTLPSASGEIWEKSVKDLQYHAFMLDIMGIDGDIIMHGGGVYGDRSATSERIVQNMLSLPPEVRRRVRLENDERSWSVDDLLPICERTGVPLIVDILHHQLHGSEPFRALPWSRIGATWSGRLPKLHYSEQDPSKRPGGHSEYVDVDEFYAFVNDVALDDYDVMLECKGKELALLKLRQDLAALPTDKRERLPQQLIL